MPGLETVAEELAAWLEAMRLALGAERTSLWIVDPDGRLRVALRSPSDASLDPEGVPLEGHALGWVVSEGVSLRASRKEIFHGGGGGWVVAAPLSEPRGDRVGCAMAEFDGVPRPDAPQALELAAAIAGRLINDARAAEAALEDLRRSEALYDTVLDLDRELDLRELSAAVCQRARRVTGARGAVAALWNHDERTGRIVASDGEVPKGLSAMTFRGDASYLSLALSNATSLPLDDLAGRKRLPLYVEGVVSDAGSAIILPLIVEADSIGALAVEYERPREFGERDFERLRAIALSVAPAFRNALEFGEVKAMSLSDALTGLPNRRATERALASAAAISERTGTPFSVAVVDIDHFKKVNDRFGHDVGDMVLQSVARSIRDELRPGDHAGRWGGEEFLVVLPGAAVEDAARVLERVRRRVEALDVEWRGKTVTVTVSAGLSGCPEPVRSGTAVVASADAALYQAKRGGRNSVLIAGDRA
ncbi:MAG: diguanylate cyclase [Gemmatimonadetes bacterium]|uniref:diguanylate cyclase n=1 Tax=Candidatus Kutchimonas denitrificans TaxID=3056748 RepID=A0AAE4ZAS5_9BACT|nr:diguanylate cyclase [Gemmatimonadota bacterium]NIR75712.1 diguanylate cyclase [Candidatus Kutchimonas denitrificans]NIS00325.1 diguanylate cyclase [Gemmatimonadota bacterium]NIT65984.1 diguanylate cyclase [Gemmatimonadota bacterium]NIU53688.1 diguanylate cyclase [Gemmatimonadota bacterium]